MHETSKIAGLLTVSLFLLPAYGSAQEKAQETTGDTGKPASQEVEITEDNYRQFMELKNARQQRNIMPEDAFKPTAGSQKIDKLPEDSQKHLRNQLREIIVQGDQWQPGDEGKQYPYVPSEAAMTNEALRKQESEAWGELMDNYHRREAEIYENSTRSQAAMADEGSAGGGSNTGSGSPGDGSGQPGGQPQDSQQEQAGQDSAADSYSSNAANDPNASGTAGSSQNAMEYLQRMSQQGAAGNSATPSSSPGTGQQGQNPQQAGQQTASQQAAAAQGASADPSKNTPDQGVAGASQSAMEFLQGQTQANQGGTGPGENTSSPEGDSAQGDAQEKAERQANTGQDTSSESALTSASAESEGESTTGASQNALEFLQQGEGTNDGASDGSADTSMAGNNTGGDGEDASLADQQGSDEQQAQADSGDSPDPGSLEAGDESNGESTSGVSQNALEFLEGEGRQPGQGEEAVMPPTSSTQSGTLSIKDLMNARGVGGPGNAPPLEVPKDEPDPPPDKDGGGR